jgi:hypothetical protein
MIYSSNPEEILYQIRPKKRNRSQTYTESQWHTKDGAIYEANRLSQCVAWARRYYFEEEFTYFVSVNITQYLSPDQLKELWKKVRRSLSNNGVIALWVLEISRRTNHFNYHFLLRSKHDNLKDILKFAFKTVKTNIKVEVYNPREGHLVVRYMTKAKTAKYLDGMLISLDRWATKRVLFRRDLGLNKFGSLGDFWPVGKNRDSIWAEIIEHQRRIREGLLAPGAEDYAEEIHKLIGGYYPFAKVRRCVGYFGVPSGWVPSCDDL